MSDGKTLTLDKDQMLIDQPQKKHARLATFSITSGLVLLLVVAVMIELSVLKIITWGIPVSLILLACLAAGAVLLRFYLAAKKEQVSISYKEINKTTLRFHANNNVEGTITFAQKQTFPVSFRGSHHAEMFISGFVEKGFIVDELPYKLSERAAVVALN